MRECIAYNTWLHFFLTCGDELNNLLSQQTTILLHLKCRHQSLREIYRIFEDITINIAGLPTMPSVDAVEVCFLQK